ncbi:magnesium and cobalt transport protein CorA [Actinomycetospora endophytica]|uniref:Magnesium and cobalt transport protein CorA n=1 Tax=Actinomycetospora endophytica TaxID=2291215 RepID=A0ABS8P788_9PSEU|nr:magnesium and cobalt transport protein CorA [Actinomycetospora endophytica]MCD2193792.1 magnesium and cobalt transport protein CorA [Actinomycetospora endophytica]
MSVVDNAVYRSGHREAEPDSLDRTLGLLRDEERRDGTAGRTGGDFAWIGLLRPDDEEMAHVAEDFGLPKLAVEDAVSAHQRPKIERYDDMEFVVLRPAWYVDEDEDVQVGEIHLFLGSDFVVAVRHAERPDLAAVRTRLEADPDLLAIGPRAVLYGILDRIVDDYGPVISELRRDIDQIETEVFGGDPDVSRRIYQLSREVIEFQRATDPLRGMMRLLLDETAEDDAAPAVIDLHRNLRDVADHVEQAVEAADGYRQLLERLLTVNASLVGQRQNEEMRRLSETSLAQGEEVKRISSWAAILFTPSLIGAIYGMNFDDMPELHWTLGYPFALALMVVASVVLYLVFKRRGWL